MQLAFITSEAKKGPHVSSVKEEEEKSFIPSGEGSKVGNMGNPVI